ncbi:hypothetical protein L0N24_11635 [Faecalibacterium prausnitzii]|uniref:DUF7601 domain-containing protein n=1 Tax=Faecalibacterium prausnitzii TaxID=853 RepID=UPI001EDD8239|nr:FctA domain-containing protein [Faecalibacterium prausnitzii]MCG4604157.1 hypothetical protein [Faecalibacterium prausnitzii]
MKLKKFFAGVLAAAMMLTVGATAAFATTPEYTTTPDNVDLGIMKNYKVEKGTAPKEDFTFSVTYKADKSKPYGTYTQPEASKSKTASFDSNMDAKVDAHQASLGIKISDFELPAGPGKYCFEIKENVPTNKTPGVTYDETTRYLVITVAHNDDYTGYVYYAQLFDDSYTPGTSIKNGQSAGVKVLGNNAFTNTYTANNVVISKDIKGSLSDLAAKFNFKVKLTVADTKNANQYVGAKVVHSDDTAVTVGTVWSISAKDSEDGWYDVKLGRNDQLELENLPEGVIVTVKETDGNEYTVSQNPSDISSKNANTSYAKIGTFTENTATVNATVGAVNGSIGFVNTKEGTPDMGVVLDNAPYIAMLAIVAIGGVALMLNKRRRDEE